VARLGVVVDGVGATGDVGQVGMLVGVTSLAVARARSAHSQTLSRLRPERTGIQRRVDGLDAHSPVVVLDDQGRPDRLGEWRLLNWLMTRSRKDPTLPIAGIGAELDWLRPADGRRRPVAVPPNRPMELTVLPWDWECCSSASSCTPSTWLSIRVGIVSLVVPLRYAADHDDQARERYNDASTRRGRDVRGCGGRRLARVRSTPTMTTVSLLQDPANRGGIATVVNWYEEWMTVHPRARRVYYLDDEERGGIGRLVRWDSSDPAVPRVLPRAQLPMYAAARYRMRGIWDRVDEVHVIGASSMHGSLAPANVPSLVWLATLIADERLPSLHLQSRERRLLYRTTLAPLSNVEAKVLSRASRVLAMSPHSADLIVRQGLAPANRVEVRTVPIDTDVFAPPEHGSGRTGMLFVGRTHDARKGFNRIEALLEASPRARAAGVDVVSSVTPDHSDGIRWRGRVEDLPGIYGKAELLVLPSLQEGLGIAAFEALACGTPVVAYRCGGPDRMLAESGAAILVDDSRAFRSAVEGLLVDESARAEMGTAGRRYAVEKFSARDFLADTSLFSLNR